MLNIYVCEDNEKQREFAATFASDYCIFRNLDAAVVLSSPHPKEILTHYKNTQDPALFFLDIDLGAEINGIELASRIRKQGGKASIAFLTTHSELALLTIQYKIEALDFIIKDSPENIKRKIAECISIAYERHAETNKAKTIKITVGDKVIPLNMDEIIYIETTATRHKLRLHTETRSLEFNGELKVMEEQLDERFIRSHKSYVINQEKILTINKRDNTITMVNHDSCPVSRTGKKLLSQ